MTSSVWWNTIRSQSTSDKGTCSATLASWITAKKKVSRSRLFYFRLLIFTWDSPTPTPFFNFFTVLHFFFPWYYVISLISLTDPHPIYLLSYLSTSLLCQSKCKITEIVCFLIFYFPAFLSMLSNASWSQPPHYPVMSLSCAVLYYVVLYCPLLSFSFMSISLSLPLCLSLSLLPSLSLSAARARMSISSVISFWKPEVAVRLVTDFTIFPVNYGNRLQSSSDFLSSRYLLYNILVSHCHYFTKILSFLLLLLISLLI